MPQVPALYAAPMPFDAPVTTATLPVSFPISPHPFRTAESLNLYWIDVEVSDSDVFWWAVSLDRAVAESIQTNKGSQTKARQRFRGRGFVDGAGTFGSGDDQSASSPSTKPKEERGLNIVYVQDGACEPVCS